MPAPNPQIKLLLARILESESVTLAQVSVKSGVSLDALRAVEDSGPHYRLSDAMQEQNIFRRLRESYPKAFADKTGHRQHPDPTYIPRFLREDC
jgi:hypothetical protein